MNNKKKEENSFISFFRDMTENVSKLATNDENNQEKIQTAFFAVGGALLGIAYFRNNNKNKNKNNIKNAREVD